MKIKISYRTGALMNTAIRQDCQAVKGDLMLRLFEMESTIVDAFKAVEKTQEKLEERLNESKDSAERREIEKELDELFKTEKELDLPHFYKDELKDHLSLWSWRIFKPLILTKKKGGKDE